MFHLCNIYYAQLFSFALSIRPNHHHEQHYFEILLSLYSSLTKDCYTLLHFRKILYYSIIYEHSMNALLIGLFLFMACFTLNQCYQLMESHAIDIMPRREAIRTLLNLQAPTNADKLNASCSDSCSESCSCRVIRCRICTTCGDDFRKEEVLR
jgi:hypothetical protein